MVRQFVGRTLLSGVALLGTATALAQSPSDSQALSAVLECAEVDREILRLECYDEAVAALSEDVESGRAASPTDGAASRAAAADAGGGGAANDAPRGVGDNPASAGDGLPGVAGVGSSIAGAPSSIAGERPATARTVPEAELRTVAPDATIEVEGGAGSRSTAGSGRDDRDAEEDVDRDRQVTVVDVRTNIPGRALFITSDGEEFVQTSGRMRLYLPEVPFVASVRSGAVGGMFLTPEGTRRSIRISERD